MVSLGQCETVLDQPQVVEAVPTGGEKSQEKARESRRMALLRRAGLFGTDTKGAVIRRAISVEDLAAAYRLVHDAFVEKGYIPPQPTGLPTYPIGSKRVPNPTLGQERLRYLWLGKTAYFSTVSRSSGKGEALRCNRGALPFRAQHLVVAGVTFAAHRRRVASNQLACLDLTKAIPCV
jgi:hypothetical protein